MGTIKSYTDIKQSKALANILPLDTADGCWRGTTNPWAANTTFWLFTKYIKGEGIPAWSLAALLSILPEIQGGKSVISLDDNCVTYPHMSELHTKALNLIDACYEMIIKLHKQNLL